MKITIGALSNILHHGQRVVNMLRGENTPATIAKLKKMLESPEDVQKLDASLNMLKIYLERLHSAELE